MLRGPAMFLGSDACQDPDLSLLRAHKLQSRKPLPQAFNNVIGSGSSLAMIRYFKGGRDLDLEYLVFL